MQMRRRFMLERLGLARQQVNACVDTPAGSVGTRMKQPVSASDVAFARARPGQVERGPFALARFLRRLIMHVDGAHPHLGAGRREPQAIVHRRAAGMDAAGDHQAGAGQAEDAVDGEAEIAARRRCRKILSCLF